MGAGKTTIGREVAELTQRPFVDTDEEIERRHGAIATIFAEQSEQAFRDVEREAVEAVFAAEERLVVALGGGAVASPRARELLRERAFTVWLDVGVDEAWRRTRGSDRPLAREEASFRRLHEERRTHYADVADAVASDADSVLLAALAVHVERGARLEGVAGAVVADARVAELHPPPVEARVHHVPSGEGAKDVATAERLWSELDLDRSGMVVGFGGGTTTDVTGFVAATYLRGVRWMAVPTTLVGQVDAAIGGKTGIDLAKGKNLVGAFHYPETVVVDPSVLATLPDRERRNGMAEVVKTGLLAGKPVWDLPEEEMIRACAAFKCAVCLSDPYERTGRRSILNLGHTFAHALEAASDYAVPHGAAVALGLSAALRLSGRPTDVVDEVLRPEPVRVGAERAWQAMKRDKKAEGGRIRLVLLDAPGRPAFPVELPDAEVRRELERLIAQ